MQKGLQGQGLSPSKRAPYSPTADVLPTTILCMTPDEFATRYHQHNEAGLEIDETVWANLISLAQNVLVEEIEQSCLFGAEEAAPTNR